MTRIGAAACVVALVLASAVPGHAEDSARVRYYLHLRGEDTNPATGVHDHWGVSLGVNLGRYWGLELAADSFERRVEGLGRTLGEIGVGAFVPQLRLRYPFLGDRLVPYAIAGVGLGVTEFNDRKPRTPPDTRVAIQGTDNTFPVGTLGAGLEYYFADNLAVGVEVKYLFAGDQTITLDGASHSQQVASLLTTVGLRLLVPELRPQPPAESRDPIPSRLYMAVRFGGAISTNTDSFANVEIRPEPTAYGGTANEFFGVGLGMNFGRYLGAELAVDIYEVRLSTPADVSIAEMAVMGFVPQLRVRYPLLGGLLVPYAIGGVGLSYIERNDRKQGGLNVQIENDDFGIAAAAGLGLEYFVTSNIAVGVESRYLMARGHSIRVNGGPEARGGFDAITVVAILRIFLAQFGG
jgi:opacity protein-like surface antigen